MPYALRRSNALYGSSDFKRAKQRVERIIEKTMKKTRRLENALEKETIERKKQARWSWYHRNMRKKAQLVFLQSGKIICALEKENQELRSKLARMSEGATHSMELRPRKKVRYS